MNLFHFPSLASARATDAGIAPYPFLYSGLIFFFIYFPDAALSG